MQDTPDPRIEAMLDRLGERYRGEPNDGFETRLADTARLPRQRLRPTPGRRRLLAPAMLGALAAAAAVVFAVLPTTQPAPAPTLTDDTASLAEVSFGLFDETFGISDDRSFLSAEADVSELDPSGFDEWFDDGGAL